MPYKDPKNPKLLEYKKAYYLANKERFKDNRKKAVSKWRKSQNGTEWAKNNYLKRKSKYQAYQKENIQKIRDREAKYAKELNKVYIKKQLKKMGISPKIANEFPELIEVKKVQLKIKRLIQQKNEKHQTIKERISTSV